MSSDYDIKIKSLFDQAKTGQPGEEFIQEVMKNIRRQERKANVFMLALLLAVIPFLWVMSPALEDLVLGVNSLVEFSTSTAAGQITEISLSPETCIFLLPLLAYYLYINRRRFI